jgi:hypothetical protein
MGTAEMGVNGAACLVTVDVLVGIQKSEELLVRLVGPGV